MKPLLAITVVMAALALGLVLYARCLESHSFLNCAVTKGWGFATWLD